MATGGGGGGDMEMHVTEAEWAWYVRRGASEGKLRMCCSKNRQISGARGVFFWWQMVETDDVPVVGTDHLFPSEAHQLPMSFLRGGGNGKDLEPCDLQRRHWQRLRRHCDRLRRATWLSAYT